jgi:hypothetical protein
MPVAATCLLRRMSLPVRTLRASAARAVAMACRGILSTLLPPLPPRSRLSGVVRQKGLLSSPLVRRSLTSRRKTCRRSGWRARARIPASRDGLVPVVILLRLLALKTRSTAGELVCRRLSDGGRANRLCKGENECATTRTPASAQIMRGARAAAAPLISCLGRAAARQYWEDTPECNHREHYAVSWASIGLPFSLRRATIRNARHGHSGCTTQGCVTSHPCRRRSRSSSEIAFAAPSGNAASIRCVQENDWSCQ